MPRLLIVDDESAICYSIRRMFADTSVEIETASTAATGLKKAQAGAFDLRRLGTGADAEQQN